MKNTLTLRKKLRACLTILRNWNIGFVHIELRGVPMTREAPPLSSFGGSFSATASIDGDTRRLVGFTATSNDEPISWARPRAKIHLDMIRKYATEIAQDYIKQRGSTPKSADSLLLAIKDLEKFL